ncbi:serine hydrolase domain-containing protein [Sorangium sp. So ce1000]|uniref:serine hydrolase domain-containing protein n=1 Tax=Sorangium sp. So ce1000 TaxID=3133325 RepID=UPI003F611D95
MRRVLRPTAFFACASVVLLAGCASSSPAPLDIVTATDHDGSESAGVGSADAGSGGSDDTPGRGCGELSAELQRALDAAVEAQRLPGAAAAVTLGGCSWRGAAGIADTEADVAIQPGDLFRAGSITKTFVATLVLMLRAEGRLSLDDAVAAHVDGIPRGDRISVRQILNHTSGIFDYTAIDEFWTAAFDDPTRTWTPAELIDLAASKPPYFEPGGGFAYSNTNYIIAGLIVEAASGEPIGELLRARVLEPAGLAHTYLDGAEAALPGLVHGYGRSRGELVEMTSAIDASAAGAAGALVSTAGDLTSFYRKVLDGTLLGPAELEEMTAWVDAPLGEVTGYGLGLSRRASPLGVQVGHDGGIWGFTSSSYSAVDKDASITVLVNLDGGDVGRIVDDLSNVLISP